MDKELHKNTRKTSLYDSKTKVTVLFFPNLHDLALVKPSTQNCNSMDLPMHTTRLDLLKGILIYCIPACSIYCNSPVKKKRFFLARIDAGGVEELTCP
jgi:hypothetical protein